MDFVNSYSSPTGPRIEKVHEQDVTAGPKWNIFHMSGLKINQMVEQQQGVSAANKKPGIPCLGRGLTGHHRRYVGGEFDGLIKKFGSHPRVESTTNATDSVSV